MPPSGITSKRVQIVQTLRYGPLGLPRNDGIFELGSSRKRASGSSNVQRFNVPGLVPSLKVLKPCYHIVPSQEAPIIGSNRNRIFVQEAKKIFKAVMLDGDILKQ